MLHNASLLKAFQHASRRAALAAARRLTAAAGVVGVAAVLAPAPAAADAIPERPAEVKHRYKMYVGGVLIGKAWLTTRFTEDGYDSNGKVETDGVAGWFVAAKAKAQASGALNGAGVTPNRLDVDAKTEGESWTMSIAYDGDAPSQVSAEPPMRSRKWDFDPATHPGALDPVSAVVRAMTGPVTGDPCNRVLPVFDGRKRHDVVLEERISDDESRGKRVVECAARWRRVAGFKPKMMAKPDFEFTVRFEIRDGLTVPTKVWGDTEFGGAVVVMR